MATNKANNTRSNTKNAAEQAAAAAENEALKTAMSEDSTDNASSEEGDNSGTSRAGSVRYIERDDGASRVVPSNTVNVQIVSTIIDRLAGTVVTEPIFREKPNLNMIMRRASNPGVREKCAQFFLSNKLVEPLTSVIPVNTLKPGDAAILQKDLFKAISKVENDPKVQLVVTEIVNAFLIGCGVVQDSGTFTTRIYYPFKPVTTASLADDIGMQEVVRVLGSVDRLNLSNKKYTNRSFAAAAAQALYPVGKALLDVNELSGVIGDMVLGVRASIDPTLQGFTGSVTQSWRDNVVIQELAKNYVFVDAALSLPVGDATPLNDGWKLNSWAPIILAALKTSPRYAIVGKSEVVRSLGLTKIRDLRGRPVSYVLYRSAKPEPVAQSVYAFEDAEISGAMTIIPTKERVAEAVAAAYGQTAGLGTDAAVSYLVSFLTDVVEAGYTNYKLGYHVDLGSLQEAGHHEVACLISDRVRVKIEADGRVIKPGRNPDMSRDYGWWYHVTTSERDFGDLNRGVFDSTTYVTNRLGEVFIAADEFAPQNAIDPRPQLIAPVAFDSRIMAFDPDTNLASLSSRYSWDITVNNSRVSGGFKASELGGMKSLTNTSLVIPIYNDDVFHTVMSVFDTISSLLADVVKRRQIDGEGPDQTTVSFLRRSLGRAFLRYAQNLAPGFRQEIHNGMIDRAVTRLQPDAAMALRARLGQREFGGYADVSALLMFLTMQGFNTEKWTAMAKDLDMARVFLEYGSDRNSTASI
jgi:hypothetical protein